MRHSIGRILFFAGMIAGIFSPLAAARSWEVSAQWHRFLRKPVRGTLIVGDGGVAFHSARLNGRWQYDEIHTFDLASRELQLTTYKNRHWHEPGERRYRFTFSEPIPAEIAAALAARVGKPSRNDVPVAAATAFAEIPAHLRARFGGSNGMLRLKDRGIDYVTQDGREGRSWRWADIRTIANPNPYELRITAYREIAEFELKRPLPREQFERLWDRLYAADLNLSVAGGSR